MLKAACPRSYSYSLHFNLPHCYRLLLCNVCRVQKRGKDFWVEFELYVADLLVGVVVDIALVGMLAPYARIGKPSLSKGLLGQIQQACSALPSRDPRM